MLEVESGVIQGGISDGTSRTHSTPDQVQQQRGGYRRGRRLDAVTHSHLHAVISRECHAGLRQLAVEFKGSVGEMIEGLWLRYRETEAKRREKKAA